MKQSLPPINVSDLKKPSVSPIADYTPALKRLWNRSDAVYIVVFFILAFVIGQIISAIPIVMQEVSGSAESNTVLLLVLAAGSSAIAGIGAVLIVNRWRPKHSWVDLGFVGTESKWYLIAIALGVVAVARIFLINWLSETFPVLNFGLEALEELLSFDSTSALVVGAIVTAIVAPIWEEIFFRGFFHNVLRNRMGMWPAILLSSLAFGIFHIVPLQGIGAFILGIILAWIYEKSGSLWPVIFLHAVNNFLAIVVGYFFFQ